MMFPLPHSLAVSTLAAVPPPEPQSSPQAQETAREFTWAASGWLWLLLLLIPLLLLRRRLGGAASIDHPSIRFIADKLHRPSRLVGRLGPLLATLAAACFIVALARPQWRHSYSEQKVSGIDIMIACDLSGSMASRDMRFTGKDRDGRRRQVRTDRLTAAKHVINDFVESRPNDRIGLVAFAGKAKLCSPLTLDHAILRYVIDRFYLASVDRFTGQERPGYIAQDGTAIGTAIASAATRLHEREETKSKVIILVTDGINNQGSITPVDAAKQAAELGIKIFTIAIGSEARLSHYTADVDTIDEKTLQEIAALTGGRYYRANSGARLLKAFASIDKLEKTDIRRRSFVSYDELFPWPLSLACLLLMASCLISLIRPTPAP